MDDEIAILIADDHPIVRQGLRQTIEATADLKVIAEASDGREALEKIEALKPSIAVLDIQMPQIDGFGVARAVRERSIVVQLIFLTAFAEEDLLNEALDLSVRGYVLKESAVTDIVACIRAVASGQHYASPALTTHLVNRAKRAASLAADKPGIASLTPSERRVLALIAEYKTNKEIASDLSVSPRTVEAHRTHICQKLDIHGSHALMKFALAHKSELT
jgi:DNA-binding NarL/FixJ family response regulator